MPRKDRIAAAVKASGMTPGSVGVAISTQPELRKAFGLSVKPIRRTKRAHRVKGHDAPKPGVLLAAKNAVDQLGFDDLVDLSRHLRRALVRKLDSAKAEIRSYRLR